MVGRHRRFTALIKRDIPGVIAIHCLIHRYHLAAKHVSGKLHDTLDFIVKCINIIKAKSLNDRISAFYARITMKTSSGCCSIQGFVNYLKEPV